MTEYDDGTGTPDIRRRVCTLRFALLLALSAAVLTFLALLLVFGGWFGLFHRGTGKYAAMADYSTVLDKIIGEYIGEYDVSDISTAALRAAAASIEDNWSYYMTPEEYEQYQNSSNNQFAGIGVGVVIDEATGGMGVTYTYAGSPAEEAGIAAGDVITGIDGESIIGMTLDEMRAALERETGTAAELSVLRADGSEDILTVTYGIIFSDPISYEMLEGGIGYVDIANFEKGSSEGFIAAVDALSEEGADSFIFDVRGNGGGRVSELTVMLDYLLPEGEIFVSVDRSGFETVTMSDKEMKDFPAVVLADRYSFSAAEYFAALLREYNFANIVGEQTTGKSRSQVTWTLPGGGALHLSTRQYLTKNRVALFDEGGLTPDFELVLSDEEFSMLLSGNLPKESDRQLLLALSVLAE